MKVKPTGILDRDLSLAITKEVRDVGGPMLREIVDEGIRAFERCSASADGADEQAGVVFPFLHLVETLDGVEIALAAASTHTAEVLLRTTFEALLAVEWVTREPSRRYGAAYVVAEIHRRIRRLERFKAGHPRRRETEAMIRADDDTGIIQLPLTPQSDGSIPGLRALLDAEHLKDAAAEYARTAAVMKTTSPPFYALWDGPRRLDQLARELKRGTEYEFLYRAWSRTAHGEHLDQQLAEVDGVAGVHVFRSGAGISSCYVNAAAFGFAAIRAMLRAYRPDEVEVNGAYSRWYGERVRQAFTRLARVKQEA